MKWERIAPKCRAHAHKHRQALAGALELHRSGRWGRPEIEAAGLQDYLRTVGHPIAPRTFWRLFDRVVSRDGGKNDFTRLDLYLPGAITARAKVPAFEKAAAELPALAAVVVAIADPVKPSRAELQLLWDAACGEFQRLVDAGGTATRARKTVLRALVASGIYLAPTYSALRENFRLKLGRWIAGGCTTQALRDLRNERSGYRRQLPLSEDDVKTLIAAATTTSVSKAWREKLRSGTLSGAVVQAYISNPASISYVPERVRDLIGPAASMVYDIHHGPRQAALKGAYISRDWSDTSPGDWWSSDDTTLPVYFCDQDEFGEWQILRGQFLPMMDCRTMMLLKSSLRRARNYNAPMIAGLIRHTEKEYGLPRQGFYFENGMWATSRLLKGDRRASCHAEEKLWAEVQLWANERFARPDARLIPAAEAELGFREYGLKFRHADPGNARAKVIERVFRSLQDSMEGEPGYCGRNEQIEKYERLQDKIQLARLGKIDPRDFLLTAEQWSARLAEICDDFNNERQDGRMLRGLSPREAWEASFDPSTVVKFSPEARYLFANHRSPIKVQRNGIPVRVSKETYWFRNEVTGRLIGRTVQVYFNPDDMSSCFIKQSSSDKTADVIPLARAIPAMTATREEMADAKRSVAAQNRPTLELYQSIKTYLPANRPAAFRPMLTDSATVELGREIADDQAAIRAGQDADGRRQRQLAKQRRRFGAMPTQETVAPEQQAGAYKLLEEEDQR